MLNRSIAAAIALAIAVIGSLVCLTGEPLKDPCCAAMASKCSASMASKHDCCKTEAALSQDGVAAAARVELQKHVATIVAILTFSDVLAYGDVDVAHPHRLGSPPTRGVPLFALLSTLRV